MRLLLVLALAWQGCTLNNGDLLFIDGRALCLTGTTPEGPALECWRVQ